MWDWTIWGALILGGIVLAIALALLVHRIIEVWHHGRRVQRRLGRVLHELAEKTDAASQKAAVTGGTAELESSLRRLRRSLAQLAVLRQALEEAQGTFGVVTAIMPRK